MHAFETADFDSNPIFQSPTPQGFLGFAFKGNVRMVLHFHEKMAGIACVSSICVFEGDFEATPQFFKRVAHREDIVIGEECLRRQPRYRLIMAHTLE